MVKFCGERRFSNHNMVIESTEEFLCPTMSEPNWLLQTLFYRQIVGPHQTNLYSLQKKKFFLNNTIQKIYFVIGSLLFSGYGKYANKRMLWSSLPYVPVIFQKSIRLTRLEQILSSPDP